MPQEKKGRNPRVSKGAKAEDKTIAEIFKEKRQCHVHDELFFGFAKDVRENVCVSKSEHPFTEHTDGKRYCLFHLPTNDKDTSKFMEILKARFEKIGKAIAERDEQSYDFRYVWFPAGLGFVNSEFKTSVFFDYATFGDFADFKETKFNKHAFFIHTKFLSYVDFEEAEFSDYAQFESAEFKGNTNFDKCIFRSNSYFKEATFFDANFRNARFFSRTRFDGAKFNKTASFWSTNFFAEALFSRVEFSAEADFNSVTFMFYADFSSAIFTSYAIFSSAIFTSDAYFHSARFEETSQAFFNQTSFQGIAAFQQAIVKGYLYFEAGESQFFDGEWLDVEKTKPKRVKRETIVFENSLNFAHVKAEKPERVSFQSVRLQPSWFVNTDSRKFIFTNCKWRNSDDSKITTKKELKHLNQRGINNPHNLLRKASKQIADNYDENKAFELASQFRQIAYESKRLQKPWHPFTRDFLNWQPLTLHWWYFLSSRYGESWKKAFIVLMSILFVFSIYYHYALFQICPKDSDDKSKCVVRTMGIGESIHQSFMTATLQNVEYRKTLTIEQDFIILLEKVFAPVQAALLALAIRRKFMR